MGILSTCNEYNYSKTKSVYPITVVEAKKHLRIDNSFTDDDSYLSDLIIAATSLAENYINADISKTENTLVIYKFYSDYIKVYESNFHSVISLKDTNDQDITESNYIKKHLNYFIVQFNNPVQSDVLNFKFYTGYDQSTCPVIIKQAIKIIIADLYDSQRSNINWSGMTNNHVWENLLNYYVQIRF